MSEEKRMVSVSHQKSGFTVPPSPLNAVKFELGVILVVGLLLLLIQWRLDDLLVQFLLLSGYGLLSMGWIMFRTRRVLIQNLAEQRPHRDESQ